MPELLDGVRERKLVPGDVIMVARKMRDKVTKKPFDWKFFMVVTKHKRWIVRGYVVGGRGHLKDNELTLGLDDDKNTAHYLPIEEWPDGIHAFRMALIMQRKIEDL